MNSGGALGLTMDGAGIVLRALGLWLDPWGNAPAAFISHAHVRKTSADVVLASCETLAIARALAPDPTVLAHAAADVRAMDWQSVLEWPIAREFGGGVARLRLAPAGHVIGGAQLVVDHPRGRFVYTGDWSAVAEGTHPAGSVVIADEVLMNAGFGLPIFRFPPFASELEALVGFCAEHLRREVTPCVLAGNPGLAQAIVGALSSAGLPVVASNEVARANVAYRDLGVALADGSLPGARAVRIAPADLRATNVRVKGRCAVAYASGWALLDAAVEQKRADAAFVLADAADFDALLGYAESSSAKHVYAARGDARTLAHVLRARGVSATALDSARIDERSAF